MTRAGHNPFATCFTRPGAVEFLFPPPISADSLIDHFRRLGRRAQIVGPHGSGKSTLVATLQAKLVDHGYEVLAVRCRSDLRRLPASLFEQVWTGRTVVLVDGYEQLAWRDRLMLRWCAWLSGAGWLLTTHRRVAGPVLWRMRPDLNTVRQIVHQLLERQGLQPRLLDHSLASRWPTCRGNVRELLFALFDEVRSLSSSASIVTEVSDASCRDAESQGKT